MESIRILQDTYEKLYAITPSLASFLETEFKNLSPLQWKENYVEPVLQKTRYIGNWQKLSDIDSYYLLELLNFYWRAFREKSNSHFFSWENRNLFIDKNNEYSLLRIRNEVSHPTHESYSTDEYIKWNESFENAAYALGSNIDDLVKNLHTAEKRKILDFLFENTSNKTLKSPDLPDDIRASILNTKSRLEALPSAAAVMTFLRDAQTANRGIHIRDTLKKMHLPTFDEYMPQVEELYKGMTERN